MIVANTEIVERCRDLCIKGWSPVVIGAKLEVPVAVVMQAIRDNEFRALLRERREAEAQFMRDEAPALLKEERRQRKVVDRKKDSNALPKPSRGRQRCANPDCDHSGGEFYKELCPFCGKPTRAPKRSMYGDTGVSAQHLGACVEYPSRMLVHEVSHWES